METENRKALSLVIADDDSEDQYIMQKLILDLNHNHKVTSVYNGMQLMEYLLKQGMYTNRMETTPDCIFLDLNMPLINGTEALRRIRAHRELQHLPIYVLSTVKNKSEKQKLISLGADGFYLKDPEQKNFRAIISEILDRLLTAQLVQP
jgi:CheY-like chemotaxis protein